MQRLFILIVTLLCLTNCKEEKPTLIKKVQVPSLISNDVGEQTLVAEGDGSGYYICYKGSDNPLEISIFFDKEGRAHSVKYLGQNESVPLKLDDSLGEDIYTEYFYGKESGKFKLSKDDKLYLAEYTRKRDGQVYNFIINHRTSVLDGSFRKTPCY